MSNCIIHVKIKVSVTLIITYVTINTKQFKVLAT